MKNLKTAFAKTLAAALAVSMIATTPVSISAAAKNQLVVSNKRDVLVAGRIYDVKKSGATNFKSSNTSVATISKTGKITPKKTGYVVISATVNGKKLTSEFLCVSKDGKTTSQSKVNKMLKAANVKKITISSKSEGAYKIADGDYSNKTLTVNVPNSDVTNSGTFKNITIKNVKDTTWFEKGDGNTFKITDKVIRFVSSAASNIKKLTYAAVNGKANIVIKGEAEKVAVTGTGADTKLTTTGTNASIKAVEVDAKDTKVAVSGTSKEKTSIVATANAENATLDVNTTNANVTLNADAKVNVGADAKDVEIKTEKGVEAVVTVDKNNKDANVKVTDSTGKTETVKPGESVEVKDDTTTPDNGGSSNGGGSVVTSPKITSSYKDGITTYTLTGATKFEDLKTAVVTINNGSVNKTVTITRAMSDLMRRLLNDEKGIFETWKSNVTIVDKSVDGYEVKFGAVVSSGDGAYTREVTVSNKNDETGFMGTYSVTVTGTDTATSISVKKANADTTYTVSRSGNTYTVTNGNVAYTVTKVDDKTLTVTGDTTKKVVFGSLTK